MKKYNRAIQKINNAHAEFRKSIFAMNAKDIYDFAYKIYCIEEIYEFLINDYAFSSRMIKSILEFKGNILLHIYEEWTDYEANYYHDFCLFVESTLQRLNEYCIEQKCA